MKRQKNRQETAGQTLNCVDETEIIQTKQPKEAKGRTASAQRRCFKAAKSSNKQRNMVVCLVIVTHHHITRTNSTCREVVCWCWWLHTRGGRHFSGQRMSLYQWLHFLLLQMWVSDFPLTSNDRCSNSEQGGAVPSLCWTAGYLDLSVVRCQHMSSSVVLSERMRRNSVRRHSIFGALILKTVPGEPKLDRLSTKYL